MTALNLKLMDITGDWVSSFVMLCQTFTAADSSCLFVGLSQFCLQQMLNRVEIRTLTWPLQNIPLFYLQKLLGCFCCMFWVIVHLYYEVPPNQFCSIWLNLGRGYIPILQNSSGCFCPVTSSLNTSNLVPMEAMHAHAITLLHHVSQMMLYALDHKLFQAFSIIISCRHSATG